MNTLRIGSRKSPLSYRQTQQVVNLLAQQEIDCETRTFMTSGDRFLDAPLRTIGGKGLFTKEIEEALLRNDIDCAVHSYKDMPTQLPAGLTIAAVLEREDVRDVWISRNHTPLTQLLPGTKVGTSSLRRQVQLKRLFPHLVLCDIRGNVPTRIEKMQRGDVDGLILAYAGLKRLKRLDWITEILPLNMMFPAVAQGALVVECAQNKVDICHILQPLDHAPTRLCTDVERAFLGALDGSCRTPIGGYAWIDQGTLFFRGFIASPEGQVLTWIEKTMSQHDVCQAPGAMGEAWGKELQIQFQREKGC